MSGLLNLLAALGGRNQGLLAPTQNGVRFHPAGIRMPQGGAQAQPMPQGPMVMPGAPVPQQLGMPMPPMPVDNMGPSNFGGGLYSEQAAAGAAARPQQPRRAGPTPQPAGGMSADMLNQMSLAAAMGQGMPQGMPEDAWQNIARFYGRG